MKTTVNIELEKELLIAAEQYAEQHQLSLAQLIESFFKRLSAPASRKNVVQMVRELEKPMIEENKDLMQAYHEEQKSKHGF